MIPVENESRFLTSLFAELNAAGVRYDDSLRLCEGLVRKFGGR